MNADAKPLKCGLIMPISAIDGCSEAHWDEVRIIIKEALAETPFVVELVSDSNEIGIIQKRIVQNIYDNDIVICDVSAKNPNVMFELGMRLAFDKPAIIIKDDKTNYSFDTSPIEHIQYPRDLHYPSVQVFKQKIRDKVTATHAASIKEGYTTFLKHFGQFVVAKIEEKPVGKEEFILDAISELRSEVVSLIKIQRSKDSFHFTPSKKTLSEKSIDWIPEGFGPVEEMESASFILDFSRKNNINVSVIESDSATFNKMVREYIDSVYSRSGRGGVDASAVEKMFRRVIKVYFPS